MKEGTKIKVNLKVKSGGKERVVGSGGQSGGIGSLNLEDEKKDDGFGDFQDSNW